MDYKCEETYDDIPLEPVTLMNNGEEENRSAPSESNEDSDSDLIEPFVPNISFLRLKRKKPLFKIRLFDKKSAAYRKKSYSVEDSSERKSTRDNIRILTTDEAEQHSELFQKRQSLPLEKCPICNKYFRRMATHLLKHSTDNFICDLCNKSFNTQSNLMMHLRTHTDLKPYVCEVCSKGFSQSCNLVNHMRIHSGEKPFKCPHCDKAFTQSGNLNNHIRLHTNEKPFKCHFCDKAFIQSGNLNSHINNNHKDKQGINQNFELISSEAISYQNI